MNILITGGASGLGKAIVEALAVKKGCNICFTYNRHEAVALALMERYPNVEGVYCDFKDVESVSRLLNVLPAFDPDVLINNAYVGNPDGVHFHKQEPEDYLNAFLWNVMPLISITKECVALFRKKKSGKIINILTAFLIGFPPAGYAVYASTKAYIGQLSKSWSKEYIRYGITSNCILPAFMETEFTSGTDERIVEQMKTRHPLKRILKPEEVAEAVVFLINASTQVNGVSIPVDAGGTAG